MSLPLDAFPIDRFRRQQVNSKTGIAAVLIALALVPGIARAQSASRFAFAGTLDYTRITDDESFLGSGIGGAGTLGWRLTEATSLEVEVGQTRHVRDLALHAVVHDAQGRFDGVPYTQRWEGTSTFVLALVAHAFGSGSVRPVIWGGGGVMTDGGTKRGPVALPQIPPGFSLQPGQLDSVRGERSTARALDGGAGVEVRMTPRVTLRPFAGLRLANTGNFGPKYVIRTGIRVGFQ